MNGFLIAFAYTLGIGVGVISSIVLGIWLLRVYEESKK